MPTTNWEAIETEYVTSEVSYAALAVKHHVGMRQLAKHAAAGEWVKKRQEWRNKSATKAREKCTDETVEIHSLLYRIWRELLDRYLNSLQKAGIEIDADEVRSWTKLLMADLEQKRSPVLRGLDISQMADADLDRILADEK